MNNIKFSIIIVSYNAGPKIRLTLDSILKQTYSNYEVIIQDSCSTDGSMTFLPQNNSIRVFSEKDNGIYDGMNRGVKRASGDYLLFINCGDLLFSESVLSILTDDILKNNFPGIIYGDVYIRNRNCYIREPDRLDNYTIITRTICHQCIAFKSSLFTKQYYEYEKFHFTADMAFYVKAIKIMKTKYCHVNQVISSYEGDGTSDELNHKKLILKEKKKIMNEYFTSKERTSIRIKRIIHFRWLKEKVGTIKIFNNFYEKIATMIYKNNY